MTIVDFGPPATGATGGAPAPPGAAPGRGAAPPEGCAPAPFSGPAVAPAADPEADDGAGPAVEPPAPPGPPVLDPEPARAPAGAAAPSVDCVAPGVAAEPDGPGAVDSGPGAAPPDEATAGDGATALLASTSRTRVPHPAATSMASPRGIQARHGLIVPLLALLGAPLRPAMLPEDSKLCNDLLAASRPAR